MNTIEVHHVNINPISGKIMPAEHVANVRVDEDMTVNKALEYAYRWTNNINGSWSREDIEDNADYNENVEVVKPLREDGLGHRSTMINDRMFLNGKEYKVDIVGFEEVQ